MAATSAVSVAWGFVAGDRPASGADAAAIKAQTRDGVVEGPAPLPSGCATQKVEITPARASVEG